MMLVVRTTNKTRRVIIPNFMLRRQSESQKESFRKLIRETPKVLGEKGNNRYDLTTPWKRTYFNVDNIDYVSFYFVPKEFRQ